MDDKELRERLDFIEFRQDLLFHDTGFNRLLFEHGVTRNQYKSIMNLMDEFRAKIEEREEVHHGSFETRIYDIVPAREHNYHFAEDVAQTLHEEGRWEEVFVSLYGAMPKFDSYMQKHR